MTCLGNVGYYSYLYYCSAVFRAILGSVGGQNSKKLHRCILTPNSSVFGHCVVFWLIRLNAFRLRRHSSIRRGPRTEHVRGLLQRRSIPDSLCLRVLHCVSNQPVHIWLPKSVARKNNHGLTRNPREPSDWQPAEGKNLKLATRRDTWGDCWGDNRGQQTSSASVP